MRSRLTTEELASMNSRSRVVRETERAQHHLWELLDPGLTDKSAAVKTRVQKWYFHNLFYSDTPLIRPKDELKEWIPLAVVVAKGMSSLFAHGVKGWDNGLVRSGSQWFVQKGDGGDPVVPLDSWQPFVNYDRTVANPSYAGCFSEETQRMRSGICIENANDETKTSWREAQEAHWRMLKLEASIALFDSTNAARLEDGMDANFLGGLFLLTALADNWPKRTELFADAFWLLRIWHFALERNTGMKMTPFSTDAISNGLQNNKRQTRPDPLRSYCWLDNALQVMVSLKVLMFYRVRHHAYDRHFDRPKVEESELRKRFRVDRHDVEQSKNHWLPSTSLASSKETSPVLGPSESSSTECMSPLRLDERQQAACGSPLVRDCIGSGKSRATRLDALAETLSKNHKATSQPLMPIAYVRMRIDSAQKAYDQHIRALRMCTATFKHFWITVRSIQEEMIDNARATYRQLLHSDEQGNAHKLEKILAQFQISPLCAAKAKLKKSMVEEGMLMFRGTSHPPLSVKSDSEWESLFGNQGACHAESCTPKTGLADREADSHQKRLDALTHHKQLLNDLASEVGLPIEATALYTPSDSELGLEHPIPKMKCPSIQIYEAHAERIHRNALVFERLVDVAQKNMVRVVKQSLMECMIHASHHPNASSHKLTIPFQRECDSVICDVLHRLLALSRKHDMLRIVQTHNPSREVFASQCMAEWDSQSGVLTLGEPCDYMHTHWMAFAEILDICVRVEPLLRDQKSASIESLLPNARRICIHESGRLMEDLSTTHGRPSEDLSKRYGLEWPPAHVTDELATIPRMKTLLTWAWTLTIERFGNTATTHSSTQQPTNPTPYTVKAPTVTQCSFYARDLALMHRIETPNTVFL